MSGLRTWYPKIRKLDILNILSLRKWGKSQKPEVHSLICLSPPEQFIKQVIRSQRGSPPSAWKGVRIKANRPSSASLYQTLSPSSHVSAQCSVKITLPRSLGLYFWNLLCNIKVLFNTYLRLSLVDLPFVVGISAIEGCRGRIYTINKTRIIHCFHCIWDTI